MCIKLGEKCTFRPKKARPILVVLLVPSLLSLSCLKMAKICCFYLSKAKKGGQKTRPPPYIYIYIYLYMYMYVCVCLYMCSCGDMSVYFCLGGFRAPNLTFLFLDLCVFGSCGRFRVRWGPLPNTSLFSFLFSLWTV